MYLYLSMLHRPLTSTLFPYTTLFRSTSSFIGISDFDPAPCMSLLWVTVWAFCVVGVVGLFLCSQGVPDIVPGRDRKSTRLNSSHRTISYAVFCLKKKIHRMQLRYTCG